MEITEEVLRHGNGLYLIKWGDNSQIYLVEIEDAPIGETRLDTYREWLATPIRASLPLNDDYFTPFQILTKKGITVARYIEDIPEEIADEHDLDLSVNSYWLDFPKIYNAWIELDSSSVIKYLETFRKIVKQQMKQFIKEKNS